VLGTTTVDTVTIQESDPAPTVTFAAAAQTLAQNAGAFSVPVKLSAASNVATTVPFTLGGTAAAGTDFSGLTTSPLVIPAGQTSGTITGSLLINPAAGVSRTLTLTLGAPTNAIAGTTTTHTLTIQNTATHLVISAPSNTAAGASFIVTVAALTAGNTTATSYNGVIHFTSTDAAASLPTDATLTGGFGFFLATLRTAGSQIISATDLASLSLSGVTSPIVVSPAAAAKLAFSGLPATALTGNAVTFTVTALDPFGNVVTGYTGLAHFTSSDPSAVLPADTTLTRGAGTFSATFKSVGSQTITATDTAATNPIIGGTSSAVAVSGPDSLDLSLDPASDTGASQTDNLTNLKTPTFVVKVNQAGTITMDFDGNGTTDSTRVVSAAGAYSFTSMALADGTYAAKATFVPAVGAPVNKSISVTIDTTPLRLVPANTGPGSALQFDGVNDFVQVPDVPSLRPTSGLTLEGWVNFTTGATDGQVVGKPVGTTYFDSYTLWYQAGALRATAGSSTAQTTILVYPWTPAAGTWYHVAYTYDSATGAQRLYLNGAQVLANTSTANILGYDDHPVLIGADRDSGQLAYLWSGTLDEIQIWNTARSQADIQATMNKPLTGTETGLVGYWRFDEGSGTTASDSSGHQNSGTLGAGSASAMPAWVSSTAPIATSSLLPPVASRTLTFSEAVDAATVSTADFALQGPGIAGSQPVTSVSGSGVTWTVGFAPLTSPGQYTLLVGPQIADFAGNVFDNNGNGIQGEAGDAGRDSFNVAALAPQFAVAAPANVAAGSPFIVTVTAQDGAGHTLTGYSGTVQLTSTDPQAIVAPTSATLTNGVGTFLVTLKTVLGSPWTISAKDTQTPAVAGTSGNITVAPGAASYFSVLTPAGTKTTGAPFSVTVTALDTYGNIAAGYNGQVHFMSSDSKAALPADAKLSGGVGAFNFTFNTAGSQTITATDNALTNPIVTGTSGSINALGLTVASFTPTARGFTAVFSKPFIPVDLALYGTGLKTVPDVTLVGSHVGSIGGSLIIDPTNSSVTFNATANSLAAFFDSAVLPDDTYTATLVSGTSGNGFLDALGTGLDGAGSAGHANYITTFTTSYQAKKTPVLSLPDFARGPDGAHTIKAPNDSGHGIPITLSNAVNVTDVTFTLGYNPSLLTVTGALSGAGSDASNASSALTEVGTPTLVDATHAQATFMFHDATPRSGTIVLGDILAAVPNSAAANYKAKELLSLCSIVINNGAVTGAVGGGSVHINAYLGDVTGNGGIDGLDVATAVNVAQGKDTGFAAYQLLDPALVGDPAADFSVDAGDVSDLAAFTAHLPTPVIPALPTGLTITPVGADPTLNLGAVPRKGEGEAGRQEDSRIGSSPVLPVSPSPFLSFTVPVLLDNPHPDDSTGMTEAVLALTYDPKVLTVSPADITLGSMSGLDAGWQLTSVVDCATGQIGIELYSTAPILASEAGSLVNIAFHLRGGASASAANVALVAQVAPHGVQFVTQVDDSQGQLVLSTGLDRLVVSANSRLGPWPGSGPRPETARPPRRAR
jgi:hypothetical protein